MEKSLKHSKQWTLSHAKQFINTYVTSLKAKLIMKDDTKANVSPHKSQKWIYKIKRKNFSITVISGEPLFPYSRAWHPFYVAHFGCFSLLVCANAQDVAFLLLVCLGFFLPAFAMHHCLAWLLFTSLAYSFILAPFLSYRLLPSIFTPFCFPQCSLGILFICTHS